MERVSKKADVYLKNDNVDLRISVDISEAKCLTDVFVLISRQTEVYLKQFKLESIYFREEVSKCTE